MFEIGNSLREARLRQGLDFPELEQATKIRSKYLRSLEEERFDVLPGQTYVKGFLRSYAEHLGLDGQIYVDEFNSRYVRGEEEAPISSGRPAGFGPAGPRLESRLVVVSLVAIGVVTALVIAAWRFGAPESETAIPNLPQNKPATTPRTPAARQARLVVSAPRGRSWLLVRRGSPTGRELYRGTLEARQTQVFTAPRLWIAIARPGVLAVRLNGRPRTLPTRRPNTAFAVTPAAIRVLSAF